LLTQHANYLLLSEPASLHPSVPLRGCGPYLYLEEFPGLRSRSLIHHCPNKSLSGRRSPAPMQRWMP